MHYQQTWKTWALGLVILAASCLYAIQLANGADIVPRIVKYPDPALRAVSDEISQEDTEVLEVLADAADYLDDAFPPKAGLALPQLGIAKRGFIVMLYDDPVIMINPVVSPGGELERSFEGCVSIPGTYGYVMRYSEVQVDYLDEDWQQRSIMLEGQDAFVVQHENDHLDGILFTDNMLPQDDPPQRLD